MRILALILLSAFATFGQYTVPSHTGATAAAAPTSPTVVQSGTCDTTVATCSVTFGSAVGVGHYLFCYAMGTGNSVGVSCTMIGETISRVTGTTGCSNATGLEGDCYLSTNTVGGQTLITCTMSSGSGGKCAFLEATSPSGGHAKDAGGNAHSATTAMSVATSATTTNANDLCIGMSGNSFNTAGGYTGLSWTPVINNVTANGTILLMSTVPGSTGVQTATATAQSGVTNQPEGVVCVKP